MSIAATAPAPSMSRFGATSRYKNRPSKSAPNMTAVSRGSRSSRSSPVDCPRAMSDANISNACDQTPSRNSATRSSRMARCRGLHRDDHRGRIGFDRTKPREHAAKPLPHRLRLGDRGKRALGLCGECCPRRLEEEIILRPEVVVDQGVVDARSLGDQSSGDACPSDFDDQLTRRPDEAIARAVLVTWFNHVTKTVVDLPDVAKLRESATCLL